MSNDSNPYSNANTSFTIDLPDWAVDRLNALPTHFETPEARMAEVIEFSRQNFQRNTGGPFAAGIFERDTGKLVAMGVNRVVPFQCSSAHAEVVAISLAQKRLGVYDLGAPGLPAHQLVVNWRPCTMCLGAVLWSGVRSLMIAGEGTELEEITGFDEGPVHPDWRIELAQRGIEVVDDVLREEALAAYREFAASQAFVYNARLGAD
jgi:tRNA(Arg) A34 adenosine deaminase TadA